MHLTQHWTGRWKTRERPIRQTSRGKPPKQNTIERTTIMAAGGSPLDFSSGASCVNWPNSQGHQDAERLDGAPSTSHFGISVLALLGRAALMAAGATRVREPKPGHRIMHSTLNY